jgi:hypothetical protein
VSVTDAYIQRLTKLGPADLSLLRSLADQPLHAQLAGFDLFTGLWWPLREKNVRVPDRASAWLVAKLCAWNPQRNETVPLLAAWQRLAPHDEHGRARAQARAAQVLALDHAQLEPVLRAMVQTLARAEKGIAWATLLDDLRDWNNATADVRQRWAEQWLSI